MLALSRVNNLAPVEEAAAEFQSGLHLRTGAFRLEGSRLPASEQLLR